MKTGIKAFCNKHYQAFDNCEGCFDCKPQERVYDSDLNVIKPETITKQLIAGNGISGNYSNTINYNTLNYNTSIGPSSGNIVLYECNLDSKIF